ncbi:hypothetical protein HAHE_33620 [Haloferula helveola]|uniref:Uncharacterized protein n=1 Tax=Haloferula helveola TaxID=490095 RepID=A0ABM7RFZ6_9BACT|nr:hypothetical protein HAHE_33620 [Haloferula helveola]
MKPELRHVLALSSTFCITGAHAATDLWTGGQADNIAWGQPANWDSGIHPAFDNAQEVIFYQLGAAHADRSNIGAHRIINKLTINENVDASMLIATENNGGAGQQLRFDGASAGIFIDAGAEGQVRIGEANAANEGQIRIFDGATFSGTGKGIDIVHNGTGELILSGTEVFNENGGASASVAKSGSGVLTIDGNNFLSGTLHVQNGRVNFNSDGSGGSAGITWILEDGVDIGNTSGGGANLGDVAGITILGAFDYVSEADRNLLIGNTGSTIFTLEANSTIDVGSGANANLQLEGVVAESGGSFSITKTGLGILRFRAPMNHTGGTIVSEGELHLGNDGVGTTATPGTGTVTINSPAVLVDRGGTNDRSWANVITGDGTLTKLDNHTLTLSGNSTFSGETIVDRGVLLLTGATTGGPSFYTINNEGTLAGDGGSTEGDIDASSGGALDPRKGGFAIGFDNVSLHDISTGTLAVEIDGVGDHDSLTVTGSLDITDTVLDTTGSDIVPPTASPITIIDGTTSPIIGTFAGLPEASTFVVNSQLFEITYLGGEGFDVVLTPLNDPVVEIAADSGEVTEGTPAGFTLNALPTPSGADITVNLSYSGLAEDGSDFTGVASIDILDGNPSADLDLTTIGDGVLEGAELLTVTIDSVSGAGSVVGLQDNASLVLLDGNSSPVDGDALAQTVIDAGSPVALADILVSDEAGGSSVVTGTSVEPAFIYRGLVNEVSFGDGFTGLDNSQNAAAQAGGSESGFVLSPNPSEPDGFSLEISFTPRAADVVGGGNHRHVWDLGGTANGTGLYLIDGIPYLVSKMNTNGAAAPVSLNDTDWDGNAICVPLSGSPLLANQRVSLAVRFLLDSVEYSLDGSAPTSVPLSNRNTLSNWHGNPDINFGEIDPDNGGRAALSTTAGDFEVGTYSSLTDGTSAVTYCRFWNKSDGSISATAGTAETVTATLTIRNWTSDATEGSLSASSGNGETYLNGVWTASGLASVNTALAAMEFIPGTAPVTVLDVTIDDQTSTGETTGTIIIANAAPNTVYVDDSFVAGRGDSITDADLGTGGDQGATYGYDAFRTLSEAVALVDPAGTIIMNDGDYSADGAQLPGTVTLQLTDTVGGVVIGSLGADEGTSIDIQGNDLTIGDDDPNTDFIDGPITGLGTLTKVGTCRLSLRGVNTFAGPLTVSDGFLRIGTLPGAPPLLGSLTSDIVVNSPGVVEFNASETNLTLTHSTLISGDGTVGATGPGTLILNGPANTFTGGFVLGFGINSDINEGAALGGQNGIVSISDPAQLGAGLIEARGAQLRTTVPGLVIAQDIDIYGGGLRLGGANDFELSGTITPVGNLRGIGNYGLEGRTFTLSGTLDTDGSGVTQPLVLDALEGADNGDFVITADIVGAGAFNTGSSFDDAVAACSGAHSYAGGSLLEGGTLLVNGTHTLGGPYNVNNTATLGGSGSIDALINVNAGGSLAPGTSVGSLAAQFGLNFGDNSTFEVEIDSSVPSSDSVFATVGDVSIGNTVALSVTDIAGSSSVLPIGTKLVLIDYTGVALSGEFDGLTEGATVTAGANSFTISYVDNSSTAVTLTAAGASSAYTVWASGFPGLVGGFEDDDDGDGVSNGAEWYFHNSDPTVAESLVSPLGSPTATGPGTYTFTHLRPVDSSGSTVTYEWSADLSTWTGSGGSEAGVTVDVVPGVTVPDADPDYETVTVTVTVTAGTPGAVFSRVNVTFP